jgi:hypothetical protein
LLGLLKFAHANAPAWQWVEIDDTHLT